jgi:DNA-binding transcriptional LysR family regulator
MLAAGPGSWSGGDQTWRLADLGSKHMLLKEGIGWGYMPEPMVREDLEKGWLVQLDMRHCRNGSIQLNAIYRKTRSARIIPNSCFPGNERTVRVAR